MPVVEDRHRRWFRAPWVTIGGGMSVQVRSDDNKIHDVQGRGDAEGATLHLRMSTQVANPAFRCDVGQSAELTWCRGPPTAAPPPGVVEVGPGRGGVVHRWPRRRRRGQMTEQAYLTDRGRGPRSTWPPRGPPVGAARPRGGIDRDSPPPVGVGVRGGPGRGEFTAPAVLTAAGPESARNEEKTLPCCGDGKERPRNVACGITLVGTGSAWSPFSPTNRCRFCRSRAVTPANSPERSEDPRHR